MAAHERLRQSAGQEVHGPGQEYLGIRQLLPNLGQVGRHCLGTVGEDDAITARPQAGKEGGGCVEGKVLQEGQVRCQSQQAITASY